MRIKLACLTLVTALVTTPFTIARAATADPDSSCANGMTLNFCASSYRATRIAVAGTALAGVTLLAVRANDFSEPCPPFDLPTTTTPEPATIALVGTGMLAIATRRLIRRRSTAVDSP
jgi:PEP-CTERM motif-containing protein